MPLCFCHWNVAPSAALLAVKVTVASFDAHITALSTVAVTSGSEQGAVEHTSKPIIDMWMLPLEVSVQVPAVSSVDAYVS